MHLINIKLGTLLTYVRLLLLAVLAWAPATAFGVTPTDDIHLAIKQTAERLMQTKEPSRRSPSWKTDRDTKCKIWIQMLDQIAKEQDPNFDFNDARNLYTAHVSLPNFPYPSGINPLEIKEPDLRARYEAAIAENHVKAERYNLQYFLANQDKIAKLMFIYYVRRYYDQTPEDIALVNVALASLLESKRVEVQNELIQTGFQLATFPRNSKLLTQ